jgi:hypothetical protein
VPSLFRRKPEDLAVEETVEVTEPAKPPRPRGYTPKKGEATPKRPTAGRRAAESVPSDPKAARALARKRRQQDADERRQGMMNGDDRYLTARDRGPVRRYVRDIVDARRNVGSIFFYGTIAVLVLSLMPIPALQLGSNVAFLGMLFAIMVDSVFLARRIRKLVGAKFPKHNERWGSLYFYAVMRALSFRRMRIPKPQVNLGDPLD